MSTTKHPARLDLLARITTAHSGPHLVAALNAWHRAGYGAVPGWALDVQIKRNPPTPEDVRRFLEEED
jgi:hypothetical protein